MFALLMIAAVPASLPAARAPAASAASPLVLETQVLAEARRPAGDGTTRIVLVAPTRVVPGDRVVVQVTYRNTGAQPLGGLVIADPLPRGLAYRAPAAASAAPELSVDGARYGPLESLRVALPTGGTRSARGSDVSHVRWRVPGTLPAGAGGRFAFQAVVK
jgi:uncharacterized repeat protein (TIGR01451 family)